MQGPYIGQAMACDMSGAMPLTESMSPYCELDRFKQISMKFESKYDNFEFKNGVCKMTAILSQPQWFVKTSGRLILSIFVAINAQQNTCKHVYGVTTVKPR